MSLLIAMLMLEAVAYERMEGYRVYSDVVYTDGEMATVTLLLDNAEPIEGSFYVEVTAPVGYVFMNNNGVYAVPCGVIGTIHNYASYTRYEPEFYLDEPYYQYWLRLLFTSADVVPAGTGREIATLSMMYVPGDLEEGNVLWMRNMTFVRATDSEVYRGVDASARVEQYCPPTAISLNKSETTIFCGDTERLQATTVPSIPTFQVTWSSSNPAVAVVDDVGLVTARNVGTAIITAAPAGDTNLSASCKVTVQNGYFLRSDNVSRVRGETPDTIDYAVELVNRGEVSGLQFNLSLPEGVSVAMDGDDYDVWLDEERKTRSHTIGVIDKGDCHTFLISSASNASLKKNDGALLHIRLLFDPDFEHGPRVMSFSDIVMVLPSGEQLTANSLTATIYFGYRRGDANADTDVDVADYVITVREMLAGAAQESGRGYFFDAADTNTDNIVNVTDLMGITNIVLGRANGDICYAPVVVDRDMLSPLILKEGSSAAATERLWIEGVHIECGDEVSLPIRLDNSGEYTALQTDLVLPPGIEVVSEDGEPVVDGSQRLSRDHVLSARMQDDGSLRIFLASPTNKPFNDNDGAIITVTLKATDAFAGRGELRLTNSLVVETNAAKHSLADVTTWIGAVSAMVDVNADGTVNVGDVNAVLGDILTGGKTALYDVNADGTVNVGDVNAILAEILKR